MKRWSLKRKMAKVQPRGIADRSCWQKKKLRSAEPSRAVGRGAVQGCSTGEGEGASQGKGDDLEICL